MRGRKPKPAAIRKLEGNPGKRKIRAGVGVKSKVPACPDWLDPAAKAEWRRLAKTLGEAGLLTGADRAAFTSYCVAWSQLKKAEELLAAEGYTYETEKGAMGPHPAVGMRTHAMDQMRRLGAEFGLTPSSRMRLQIAGEEKPAEDPDELLNGNWRPLSCATQNPAGPPN